SGTTTIPAIWATAISGIARKLRPRPANVTREKNSAPTGNSIASVATDAAPIAASGRTTDGVCQRDTIGATTTIARVAPNVRTKAGSTIDSGSVATRTPAMNAMTFSGAVR